MNAHQSRRTIAAATCAVALSPMAAAALPAISYEQEADETGFFNSTTFPSTTNFVDNVDGSTADYDGSTATAAISPFPAVSASSSTGVMQFFLFGRIATPPYLEQLNHSASSELTYFFTVNGPSQVAVPLTAKFNLFASVSGTSPLRNPSRAEAVGAIGGNILSCIGYSSTCEDVINTRYNIDYTNNLTFTMLSGALAHVELGADTFVVQTSQDQGSTATAYADPYIAIDPTWLAVNPGYSLAFSTGIVNAGPGAPPAVPEPASWTMLLTGFGLAGAAKRRLRHGPSGRSAGVPRSR